MINDKDILIMLQYSAYNICVGTPSNENNNNSNLTTTRDTDWVLKWVLVRIAAFFCTSRPQIWIPEIEYMQKMVSHV